MLTRSGYVIKKAKHDIDAFELKKTLTVRPIENAVGITPPAFKVYKETKDHICVPRYFGTERYGAAKETRPEPVKITPKFIGVLRDSTRQNEAFQKGVEAFETLGGGVLSLAPGFGKTAVGIALACHLGLRTIIIVHKEFLAEQWENRIRMFVPGATIGRIQQDRCETNCDFSIALIQTLSLREHDMNQFDTFGLTIVDEAHHIGSRAFSQSMFKVCTRYTLGLTATPERKDGLTRLLYWFLGPNFLTVERENQKTVQVIPLHFNDEVFKKAPPVNRMGSLSVVDIINILVFIPERNELIINTIRKCLKENRKVLFLSDRRAHCFEIEVEFGDVCGLYLGGMKQEELDASAEKQLIIGTFALAQEGLDIPTLDTVILATPHSDVKQAVGRILRETKGKVNNPVIYDIVDHWSVLMGMYRKRCQMYRESGFVLLEEKEEAPKTFNSCVIRL